MVQLVFLILLFVLGASLGSFLNVCIYRIPRRMSVARPPSHCTDCGSLIKAYDNIPILSFLILRGRCRSCGAKISPQYPIVEAWTGILLLGLWFKFGLGIEFLILSFLSFLLIISFFIDYHHQIIPDRITFPGIVLAPILSLIPGGLSPLSSLLGIGMGGGVLIAIALFGKAVFKKEAMGGGDVKLAAMIGGFVGWKLFILSIFLASFLGALAGAVLILLKRRGMSSQIPFGPFIVLGSLISIFWGEWLTQTYLGLFM